MGPMLFDGISHQIPDIDPGETDEWLDSFDAVVDTHGRTRARFLLMKLLERARSLQVDFPATVSTPYVNTISASDEPWFPGDEHLERRIRAFIRWNAAVMVTRANARTEGIGGHLSTYASSASLYEVGFNHFFRGKANGGAGDQVYIQGHASPGIYARAYVEGRMGEAQLDNFRHEVGGNGLPSWSTRARAASGASSATARWTSPSRSVRSGWPGANTSTTWCSSSTATCNGWMVRCAGTARSSRSSRRSSGAPDGTSSRSSGARAGTSSWPVTSTGCCWIA